MTLTWLDPIGASLSLLATYYFTQAHARAFPISLVAIIINSILYYQKSIYAHLGLEAIYVISSLYGWYYWSAHSAKKQSHVCAKKQITQMPLGIKLRFVLLASLSIPLLATGLGRWTDSDVPYWDATTTILALFAQWMLCKKWIECWALWFIVDALVVGLHWVKHIPFHSAIHAVYLGMAVLGYLKWRKIMIV